MIYFVYVLENKTNGNLYIGFTHDLRKRLQGHKSKDTKTTRNGDYKLIYFEGYVNKADALGREKFLKGGSGRKYINNSLSVISKKTTPAYFSKNSKKPNSLFKSEASPFTHLHLLIIYTGNVSRIPDFYES